MLSVETLLRHKGLIIKAEVGEADEEEMFK
jgi:hypothetical protein